MYRFNEIHSRRTEVTLPTPYTTRCTQIKEDRLTREARPLWRWAEPARSAGRRWTKEPAFFRILRSQTHYRKQEDLVDSTYFYNCTFMHILYSRIIVSMWYSTSAHILRGGRISDRWDGTSTNKHFRKQ